MSQIQRTLMAAYEAAVNQAHAANHRGWAGQPAYRGLDHWVARAERAAWLLRTRYGVTV